MNKAIYSILLLFTSAACSTSPDSGGFPPKMVPDRTPYIAGMIEFSPDTTHHYPEIVIGYFSDIYETEDIFSYGKLLNRYTYPGIYTPALLRQLCVTSILYGLQWEPESEAIVMVRGPLGTAKEKTVKFIHEKNGVYGDQKYALPRIPNGKYELRITLPDGRIFGARTHIPEAVNLTIPDSIGVPVRFEPQGPPNERYIKRHDIVIPTPDNAFFTIMQWNTSVDRELLLMKPDEHFRYTDRSNYLRTGIGFFVDFVSHPQDTTSPGWSQTLDKPRDEIWMKKHYWSRFSFHSKGIGRLYFPLMNIYSSTVRWQKKIERVYNHAAVTHDSTFLFEISNINKIGGDGEIIPEVREAFGFFSGYYSLYKQFTVYPIRNFDLDSVLTSHE